MMEWVLFGRELDEMFHRDAGWNILQGYWKNYLTGMLYTFLDRGVLD